MLNKRMYKRIRNYKQRKRWGEIMLTGEGDKEKVGAKEGAVQAESTTSIKIQDREELRAWKNHTQHAQSIWGGGHVE